MNVLGWLSWKKKANALSLTQQAALFAPVRHLELLSLGLGNYGLKGITAPCTDGGIIKTQPFPADVAKWAFPYAQRIHNAENFFKDGKLKQALKEFQKIEKEIPDAAIIIMNIGVCYGELGKRSLAKNYLRRCLLVVPEEHRHLVVKNFNIPS